MAGPQLVREVVSTDTLHCAEALLEGVKSGQVVGAVIGFLYKRRRYSIAICGDAFQDPTWSRGILGSIEDELRELIRERGVKDTTI